MFTCGRCHQERNQYAGNGEWLGTTKTWPCPHGMPLSLMSVEMGGVREDSHLIWLWFICHLCKLEVLEEREHDREERPDPSDRD